jgi:cell division protein FtsI/penicillin-binding protein 2
MSSAVLEAATTTALASRARWPLWAISPYLALLSAQARKVVVMKVRGTMALAAAMALPGAMLAACSSGPAPQDVAKSYLAAWADRDWTAMRALVASPPADFTTANAAALADLGAKQASYRPGNLAVAGSTAREPVTEQIPIAGIGAISIKTTLRLTKRSGTWQVAWTPATIAPQLSKPGDHLSLQVTWPPRAQILGAGGAPLTTQAAMVTVGVEGQRIKSESVVRAALLAAGATRQAIDSALTGAKKEPSWFEPVITVSLARYQQLAPAIYPVPGTVFQTIHQRAPLTPDLTYLVGSVGPVTAQQLQKLGTPYTAASVVGQTGLELAYQSQLAGRPGAQITAVSSAGATAGTVAKLSPRPGTPLQTTINPVVQEDAEKALAGLHKQAALVALDAATGQVLASVSVPAGGGFNLALDGAFPPGSSFKLLTSTALLEQGLSPSSPATCPPQLDVDGEIFHNAEGTAPISDLLHAFAESCNTAFIGLAVRNLIPADFTLTAVHYLIGVTPSIGLPAFAGSVPAPSDLADLAATAIGQGRVLVSPLNMAIVAATVDTGQLRAPSLVASAANHGALPAPLPANVVSGLHQMMAQVVASGTAAGKGLPPGTYAKTGTAQYGHGSPLPTDAWLVGFNNHVVGSDIAFAMVTVDGGEGGPTDGPIVARFLDLLHQSGE